VRVVKVDHPGGPATWIVEVPGMDLHAGGQNPSNLTENLSVMQHRRDQLEAAVLDAMRQSDIRPGEHVLLSGHSQGGIVAMGLASDPAVRREYAITHVVTAGSPVSRFHPPPGVHVLSIEHTQDPIPRLDTGPNPDRPNWTTVTRDLADVPAVEHDPMQAHRGASYAVTAGDIDTSTDPRIAGVRHELGEFLGTGATQNEFKLQLGS
jgi:alpha-beta hydrolase superfamily lysophospholipase